MKQTINYREKVRRFKTYESEGAKTRLGKLFPFTDALAVLWREIKLSKVSARTEGLSSSNYANRYKFISHKNNAIPM